LLAAQQDTFKGKYFHGRGDTEYLKLLDISRRVFAPDPEFQNLARRLLCLLPVRGPGPWSIQRTRQQRFHDIAVFWTEPYLWSHSRNWPNS
jgi:hypothetical protein